MVSLYEMEKEISLRCLCGFAVAAVPMVEAMVALVLMDQLMAQHAQCHLFPINPDLQGTMKLPELEPANFQMWKVMKQLS